MFLSLLVILTAFYWLLKETDYLRCNLMAQIPKSIQMIERRKHSPILEPCVIKTTSYPKPKLVLLLTEMCELTTFQNDKERMRYDRYRHYGYNGVDPINRDSYQTTIIGGHKVILNSTSPKLYDLIKEVAKVADSKPRKFTPTLTPLPLFVETVRIGSHTETKKWKDDNGKKHVFNNVVTDYTTNFHDCLCGKDWLEAHINDHKDFEPTIELRVNEKSISFNGNFKSGVIKDWVKSNK